MSKDTLLQLAKNSKSAPAVPLAGFPGAPLTHTSVKKNLFDSACQTNSLLKLAEKIDPDMIMVMMDLSVECDALGLPVTYPENESASVEVHPVECSGDLSKLKKFDVEKSRAKVFLETVSMLKKQTQLPVGAYICGPFTLAGLLMGATEIMMKSYDDIEDVKKVVDFCTQVAEKYAKALVAGGADVICILDPTAMMLSPDTFDTLAGNAVKYLNESLDVPVILHICGNTTHLVERMSATGVQGLSLDMDVDLPELTRNVRKDLVMIGNIDSKNLVPSGSIEEITSETRKLMQAMAPFDNFVAATGCDLPPETPIENIAAFTRAVR